MSILCNIGFVCLACNLLVVVVLCVVGLQYRSQLMLVGRLAMSMLNKQSTRVATNGPISDDDDEEGVPSPVCLVNKKKI